MVIALKNCTDHRINRTHSGGSSSAGKSAGLTGAISGGAEHLFGKKQARGFELFLSRLTIALAAVFFIVAILVAYFVKSA